MSCTSAWLNYGAGLLTMAAGAATSEVGVGVIGVLAGFATSEAAASDLQEQGCL